MVQVRAMMQKCDALQVLCVMSSRVWRVASVHYMRASTKQFHTERRKREYINSCEECKESERSGGREKGGWGRGGEEHYLTYLNSKSKQSITSFIDWHGAEFALQLGYTRDSGPPKGGPKKQFLDMWCY